MSFYMAFGLHVCHTGFEPRTSRPQTGLLLTRLGLGQVGGYSTVADSLLSLFQLVLGIFDYEELYRANPNPNPHLNSSPNPNPNPNPNSNPNPNQELYRANRLLAPLLFVLSTLPPTLTLTLTLTLTRSSRCSSRCLPPHTPLLITTPQVLFTLLVTLVLTNLFVAIVTDAYMLANVETARKKGP